MKDTRQQQRLHLDQEAELVERNWYEDESGNSIRILDETDGNPKGIYNVFDSAIGFQSEDIYTKAEAAKELRQYIKNNFLKVKR